MKNLHVAIITLGTVVAGSMIPFEPLQANGQFLTTYCYHVVDGVSEQTPYHTFFGPGSCPDYSVIEKNLPNVAPHLCSEVGIVESYD